MRLFMELRSSQDYRFMATFAMKKALEILQMPQVELGPWLYQEIEKNFFLELDENVPKTFQPPPDLPAEDSLHEHLLSQIRESFTDLSQLEKAKQLLHCLDERGFLELDQISCPESILLKLQQLDPPGIFARNLRECFLLQLKELNKTHSPAYQLVAQCFDDLLHKRFALIQKKLGIKHFKAVLHELAQLTTRPAAKFEKVTAKIIYPDLSLMQEGSSWDFEVVESELPKFHLQTQYLEKDCQTFEEKKSFREHKAKAKWLIHSLNRRKKFLCKLSSFLLKEQIQFLEGEGPLKPLDLNSSAKLLQVHESTLSRALSEKHALTPRGIMPLRSFFMKNKDVGNAKEMLQKLIQNEDRKHPLNDEELAFELKLKGINIARRTVTKYRVSLKIGSAIERKYVHPFE